MKRLFFIVSILTILISGYAFAGNQYPTMTLVQDIEYSSYLTSNNQPKLAYHPINLIDEDRTTAWFEGVEDNGVGEYIVFKFLRPINIEGINILNGYGKSSKLFYANNRIKTLELVVNESVKKSITLDDIEKKQYIKFEAMNVTKLKLIVRDIYKGGVYNDTGFSEISFSANIESEEITEDKKEEIINLFKQANFGETFEYNEETQSYDSYVKKLVSKLNKDISLEVIKEVFEMQYSNLDGAGDDIRLGNFIHAMKKNP